MLGITLSEPQAALARERVAEAGLSQRVEIRVQDYRELPDASFDAIASVGMSEHVGERQIDAYTRRLFRLLRPGGVLVNHAIAALDPDATPLDDLFATRYVFPDGEPLPLSRVQLALERAGFRTAHVEGFREDYSEPCAIGHSASTSISNARRRWPASSARACGACTCAQRARASTPASRPSIRCARASRPVSARLRAFTDKDGRASQNAISTNTKQRDRRCILRG